MSLSMLVGRIILPGLGLTLAGLLVWQFVQTGTVELPKLPVLTAIKWTEAAPPTPLPSTPSPPSRPRSQAAPPKIAAEGRVVAYPGAEVLVGAETAGTILAVLVQEKTAVHKGDLLVEFKADELKASLDEAVARVAEAEAEMNHNQRELARTERLLQRKAGTDEERERFQSRWIVARARRAAAVATVKRLEASLAKTRVLAPIDGVVVARHAHLGETVNVGVALVHIVNLKQLRIEAEVDEYDIGRCAPGRPVAITAEGYRDKSWQGVVEEVADTVIGRRIRPEDPGRPTDTRVLPVRIAFREPTPLKLGQRVEVEISQAPTAPSLTAKTPAALTRLPRAPKADSIRLR
jgi:HlyD family secretion protein